MSLTKEKQNTLFKALKDTFSYKNMFQSPKIEKVVVSVGVGSEKDKRKICGLSPIYALLNTVNAKAGRMLDYGQALEPDTGSVVSYTSIAFY